MSLKNEKNGLHQVVFWCLLWIFIPLMFGGIEVFQRNSMRFVLMLASVIFVLFFNLKILLPRLYFSKKQTWFAVAALATVLIISRLSMFLTYYFADTGLLGFVGGGPPFIVDQSGTFRGINFTVPILITMIGSTLYEISLFAARKEQEAVRLRAEKLEAEVKFLKSQMNPHFLFNTLNNIYTLTVLKSDAAPENLLKLSAMLRYMLYDCAADRVPLKKELEYLRNFVDLMQLKDSEHFNIRLELDESQPALPVAPLIFVPFIENAFKHGNLENVGKGWLNISLKTENKRLIFQVKNSIPSVPKSKDTTGGIGLENVRRQLELLYPNRHRLEIRHGESEFEVEMVIEV